MTRSTKTTAAFILLAASSFLWPRAEARAQEATEPEIPGVASSSDMAYTTVAPCRLFDTRVAGGAIPANTQRNFLVTASNLSAQGGSATGCGVPTNATAAMVNFTVVSPSGPGNLRAFATANPQPAAPLAAAMTFGVVAGLDALSNGSVVPLCDRATTACPSTGDLRIQLSGAAAHVVGDVLGYFRPGSGRAYALVNPSGPSLDGARTKNIVAVRRPSTGVYCVEPAAGINPAQSVALTTVEGGLSTGIDLLVQAVASAAPCTATEFLVRTYRFGASPISPTLSNQVAFYLLVP